MLLTKDIMAWRLVVKLIFAMTPCEENVCPWTGFIRVVNRQSA